MCPRPGCGRRYYTRSHLRRHIRQLHESDPAGKPEQCVLCGARFAKRSQLRIHVSRTHKQDASHDEHTREQVDAILNCEPYACTQSGCGRTFSTEGQLRRHMRRHEEARHVCAHNGCGARFGFRRELLRHVRDVHRAGCDGGGAVCDVCGTRFKNRDNLRQHMRRFHSGMVRIYRCPHDGCTKTYNAVRMLLLLPL